MVVYPKRYKLLANLPIMPFNVRHVSKYHHFECKDSCLQFITPKGVDKYTNDVADV